MCRKVYQVTMSIQRISFTSTIPNKGIDAFRNKTNANNIATPDNKEKDRTYSQQKNNKPIRNLLVGLGIVAAITTLGISIYKRNLKPINKELGEMTRSELAENILTALNKKEYVAQHAYRGESIDYNGLGKDVLNKIWVDFTFNPRQGIVKNATTGSCSRLRREVIYTEYEKQPYTLIAHEFSGGRIGDYIALYLRGKIPEDFAFEIADHMASHKYEQSYVESVQEWLSGIIKK